MIKDAVSVSILNLSRIAADVQAGWIIAHLGADAARADLEKTLEGASAEQRAEQLAMFDAVAARVEPPKTPRKPSAKAYTFDAQPVPMPVPARPKVQA
jgi:hypothetical protein